MLQNVRIKVFAVSELLREKTNSGWKQYSHPPRLGLNHEDSVVFHNLKRHDSHVIMQEPGKFNLKISAVQNELEKCMNFTTSN